MKQLHVPVPYSGEIIRAGTFDEAQTFL